MLRLIFILLVVGVVLAVKFLPWYVSLGVFALFVFSLKFLIRQAFMLPFKAKSAVLKGVDVTIHSIMPTQKPPRPKPSAEETKEDEEEGIPPPDDDADEIPYHYYAVDLTLAPKPATGAFNHWDPSELLLSEPGSKPDDLGGDDLGSLERIERYENGAFVADDNGDKLQGTQRLRLTYGVRPEVKRATLRYYFNLFGDLKFPS